jgi:hypothetical protein
MTPANVLVIDELAFPMVRVLLPRFTLEDAMPESDATV